MGRRIVITLLTLLGCWPALPAARGGEDEQVKKLIVQLLAHKDTKKRRLAVLDLEVVGPRVKGVLQAFCIALEKDPEPAVRRDIALSLGRMGDDGKDAVPALAHALRTDKDDKVRELAGRALVQMV